jgi:predicted Rossmann fold nucleotide-binding protein DprA/Smf involved in DNA uptake
VKKIGVIGSGSDKFTDFGRSTALHIIDELLKPGVTVVSGHSPVGGVDIWAETMAEQKGLPVEIFVPTVNKWHGGYRERNMKIAQHSDEIHVIVADKYPLGWQGRRFSACYHCQARSMQDAVSHVKSGACWTALKAMRMGKPATWYVVRNGD